MDLGRQVKYGLGKETVAGTPVSASFWLNQLKFDLNPVVSYISNDSAWGRIEKTNNSVIDQQYAKGSLNAKLTSESAGMILLGSFGSCSSSTNSDSSNLVYDHTYTINQSYNGQSLTFVRKDSLSTLAFALGRIDTFKLDMKLGQYVQYNSDVMAKVGASATATPAFVEETEFVSKHMSVKTASTASGLGSATAVTTVDSFTLTVNPNLQADFAAGSKDPYGFSSQGYDLSFEMECRYNDQTFENAYKNGTSLALQLTALNTDVVIGSAAHPGLVITAYRMFITDWARTEDLNGPITQKMTGTIHFSPSDSKALQAVLTNTTATY